MPKLFALSAIINLLAILQLCYAHQWEEDGTLLLDLHGSGTDFIDEVSSWTNSSSLPTKYSQCDTDYLLGGMYNSTGYYTITFPILPNGEYFQKTYDNLPPHNILSFEIKAFAIDGFLPDDILLDDVIISRSFITTSSNPQTMKNNCGRFADKDYDSFAIRIQVVHSAPTLSIKIKRISSTSFFWTSMGYRELTIKFSNSATLSPLYPAFCLDATYPTSCGCSSGAYSNSSCITCPGGIGICDAYNRTCSNLTQCFSCHPSCETCNGPADTHCLSCAWGRVYDGSKCVDEFSQMYQDSTTYLLDLHGSSREDFTNEALSWSSSGLRAQESKYNQFAYIYLLDGIQHGIYTVSFSKTYQNLPTHSYILFQIRIFPIGLWSRANNQFSIRIDQNTVTQGPYFDSRETYNGNNRGLTPLIFRGRIRHTSSSLSLTLRNDLQGFGTVGFREIYIKFLQSPPDTVDSYFRYCIKAPYTVNCPCLAGQFLDTQCPGICLPNEYWDGSRCSRCHSNCATCSGGGASDCTSCYTNFRFLSGTGECCNNSCSACQAGFSNVCVSCPFRYYLSDGNCQRCHSSCQTCSGPSENECLSCDSWKYFHDGKCSSCHSSCATCSGPSENECLSCSSYSTPQILLNNQCRRCHSSCASCNGISNTSCLACRNDTIFNSGSCIDPVQCTLQDGLGPACSSDAECPSQCGTCKCGRCLHDLSYDKHCDRLSVLTIIFVCIAGFGWIMLIVWLVYAVLTENSKPKPEPSKPGKFKLFINKCVLFINNCVLFVQTKFANFQKNLAKQIAWINRFYERLKSYKLFYFLLALPAITDPFSDFVTMGLYFGEGDYIYGLLVLLFVMVSVVGRYIFCKKILFSDTPKSYALRRRFKMIPDTEYYVFTFIGTFFQLDMVLADYFTKVEPSEEAEERLKKLEMLEATLEALPCLVISLYYQIAFKAIGWQFLYSTFFSFKAVLEHNRNNGILKYIDILRKDNAKYQRMVFAVIEISHKVVLTILFLSTGNFGFIIPQYIIIILYYMWARTEKTNFKLSQGNSTYTLSDTEQFIRWLKTIFWALICSPNLGCVTIKRTKDKEVSAEGVYYRYFNLAASSVYTFIIQMIQISGIIVARNDVLATAEKRSFFIYGILGCAFFTMLSIFQICKVKAEFIKMQKIEHNTSRQRSLKYADEHEIQLCKGTSAKDSSSKSLIDIEGISNKDQTSPELPSIFEEKKDFKWCQSNELEIGGDNFITDDRLQQCLKQIIDDIKSTGALYPQKLSITLKDCNLLTSEGINSMCNIVAYDFKELQTLSIDFANSSSLTDEGLKELSRGLIHQGSTMKQLTLNFKDCNFITDEGLRVFAVMLSQHYHKLSELNLGFGNCITSKGLKLLAVAISNSNIKKIKLDLEGCTRITDEELEQLTHSVGGIRNGHMIKKS